MPPLDTREFTEFMQERFGETLRSVIHYEWDEYDLLYGKDDVLAEYSEDEIEDVVEQLRYESYGKKSKELSYAHEDLKCEIQSFENGAEMNFVLGKGEGLAVGLEPEAFVTQSTFIGRCLEKAGLE
jgi:hypothetical protein